MKKGFTLIELLVVIAIIGILAGIVTVSFTTSQKQARDTQRKSDLAQYRTALESFASAHNGLFPFNQAGGGSPMVDVCTAALTGYGSSCPNDPKSTKWYVYGSDGSGATGDPTATKYFIFVATVDSVYLESAPTYTWAACSNGKVGMVKVASSAWNDVSGFCGM